MTVELVTHFFLLYAEFIQDIPSYKFILQGVPTSEPCLKIPVEWSVLERSILRCTKVMPADCELKSKKIII